VALPIVFLVGALLGLGAERGLIVRLRNASELEIVVATLALAVVLRGLLRWEFGSEAYSIPPIGSDRGMEVLGLRLTAQQMITIGFGVFVAVACWFILTRTKLGLRIRVSSADRDIASLLGIRTDRIFASVWMVSLGSAALAGAIVAPQIFVSPDMGFTPLLFGVVGAVVGGFGSFVGAVVGSYFIAFVAAFASYLGASHWQDSSVFVLLAVVLLVRPDGIFGRPTAERV